MSQNEGSVGKHFGPMHGERSRRHQMVVAGSQREGIEEIIVSVYELHNGEVPQQAVELTHGLGVGAYARADLTVAEAAALRDWLDEFVRAYAARSRQSRREMTESTLAKGAALYVASACGHPQEPPTAVEIANCPEVIVRRCLACERELWWNIDQWRVF